MPKRADEDERVEPSSLSNPLEARVVHGDFEWVIDFEAKKLRGSVTYSVEKVVDDAKEVRFDTSGGLKIFKTLVDGKEVALKIGEKHSVFGTVVSVPLGKKKKCEVKFEYETGDECTAAQWLEPEQTDSKKYPFMFTQSQAIHARSLMPCQDEPGAKMTFEAKITAPKWATTLASGLQVRKEDNVTYWSQPKKTSTYIIALACGELKSKDLSDRCRVWAEPSKVEIAAYDFEDTEKFLTAAETISGIPYPWGRYDFVVLPASFPYGGMENTNLTTVTPTLLAGDKSLAGVVAHEIAHSWTGNLVTNAVWQSFWLNEGCTRWFERQIRAKVTFDADKDSEEALATKKKRFIDFDVCMARGHLKEDVKHFEEIGQLPFTALLPDLGGNVDPDDAFSSVPYEKGSGLCHYLEDLVGSKAFLEDFFQKYLKTFAFKTATAGDFKRLFVETFPNAKVDWDTWYHEPGYLPVEYPLDLFEIHKVKEAADTWFTSDKGPKISDWQTAQQAYFLDLLLEKKASKAILNNIASMFSTSQNSEICFRWAKLLLAAGDSAGLALAVDVVSTQGRMKFTRPLYRCICSSPIPGALDTALATFEKNINFYHPICRKMVATDLNFYVEQQTKSKKTYYALLLAGVALVATGARLLIKSRRQG